MKTFSALIALLLVLVVVGAAFVWSGVYDVGADAPHWKLTERAIATLRERSIQARASGIAVPDLDDEHRVAEGAEHYAEMCTGCHLAPGMDDTEIRPGLYPRPPKLAEVRDLDPREAFWIVKHGVKLTAMPAWGTSHDDESIWNMVAFLRKLPAMTPEQYRALTASEGEGGEGHHHHHGGNSHEDDHAHAPAADLKPGAAPEAEAAAQAFSDALKRGDRTAALDLLAPEVRITEGGETQDLDDYADAHLAADMAFLKDATITPVSRASALDSDEATVASVAEIRATSKGMPVALRSSETMTLSREKDRWQITSIRWDSAPIP